MKTLTAREVAKLQNWNDVKAAVIAHLNQRCPMIPGWKAKEITDLNWYSGVILGWELGWATGVDLTVDLTRDVVDVEGNKPVRVCTVKTELSWSSTHRDVNSAMVAINLYQQATLLAAEINHMFGGKTYLLTKEDE